MISRPRLLFGLILAVAALIRILYFLEIRTLPDFTHPGLDAGYHDYWARGIAFGAWTPPPNQPDPLLRTEPYFRPPGYPWFLAGIYRLTGGRPAPAHLAQFALGLLNLVFLWRFARRWFGEAAALAAAALAAGFWGFPYYDGEWLEPTLLISLIWGVLFALARWHDTRRESWWLAAGLALGAAAVVRPNALFLAPVAIAWALWRQRARPWWGRPAQRLAGLLATGAALVIAPVALRNAIVGRDAVLISSNGGINLLLGQEREAIANHASNVTGDWNCFNARRIIEQASAEAGRPLRPSEASRWYARQARTLVFSRPRETLRLLALKTLLFWGPVDVANNKVEELERRNSRVLRHLPVGFSFLLAAALLGGSGLVRRRNETPSARASFEMGLLLFGCSGAYFLSFLPFIAAGQYRVPLIPLLLLPAGAGLAELARSAAEHRWRAFAAGLAAGLLLWGLTAPNYAGYRPQAARFHLTRGIAAERAGNAAEAETRYRAALREAPGLAVAHDALGLLYARQERLEEAYACFHAALAADPASADTRYRLALAASLTGRLPEAIALYESVLRERPGHDDARRNLATARRLVQEAVPSPPPPEGNP